MCRQMRGKIRLLFSYLSILIIGILIYLIVLFVADKHRKSSNDEIAIAPIIGGESKGESTKIQSASEGESGGESKSSTESSGISHANVGESGGESNVAKNAESPSVADKDSLNELPNEINVAINTIDSPSVPKSVADSGAFPQNFVVNTKVLRIRTAPNTDSAVIKLFKEGAVIRISAIEGKWAELENGGWAYLPLLKEHK